MAIVAALSDVADALSGAQVALLLYPSPIMKQTVSSLYAHIVRLLVRAWHYYNESRLSRTIHSITRPAALRWDDIVKMIQHETQAMAGHATASSQMTNTQQPQPNTGFARGQQDRIQDADSDRQDFTTA